MFQIEILTKIPFFWNFRFDLLDQRPKFVKGIKPTRDENRRHTHLKWNHSERHQMRVEKNPIKTQLSIPQSVTLCIGVSANDVAIGKG